VCKAYKTATDNYAFELNGRLKGGLPMGAFGADLPLLQRVICATLERPLTVYRMSSDFEFSSSVLQVLEGPFRYQAFMSTTDDASRLGSFVPKWGRPLLLDIECPPGIAFSPLDLFPGTDEGEYLLGCGTTFQVVEVPRTLSGAEVGEYMSFSAPASLTVLKLRVTANPPYVDAANLVTLIN
jgi:hypothetical protein